ncbi:MAG: type II secretion system F family protein [Planctomycetota bacterium]
MIHNRIEDQTLSTLCERVGVAFEVGLDPYRVFDREAESPRRTYSAKMKSVAEHVRQGTSLSEAIRAQGNYFPSYFAEVIEGGETTGRLDRVLDRAAEYYQQLAEFRLTFRNSILWPIVQLLLAFTVIGLLIYLPDVMLTGDVDPESKDLLGIGLVGWDGLVKYMTGLAIGAVVCFVIYWLIRNGYANFLLDWFARVPLIGKTTKVFPEARFVQTLALGIDAGIDASSAVALAFQAAGTGQFRRHAEEAEASIRQGRELHRVLDETGLFQRDTIEVIELGENSGRLAEILDKHFRLLKIEVRGSMAKLTYFASAMIWALIATMLILIIVRVFSMYINNMGAGGLAPGLSAFIQPLI